MTMYSACLAWWHNVDAVAQKTNEYESDVISALFFTTSQCIRLRRMQNDELKNTELKGRKTQHTYGAELLTCWKQLIELFLVSLCWPKMQKNCQYGPKKGLG